MWWNCARSALRISPKNILKFPRRGVRGQNFENRPLIQSQDETKWSQLIKPTIFTIGFGSTLMCGNFIYKYEVKLKEKYQNFAVAGRNELNWKYFSNLPNEGAEKYGDWRKRLNEYWNSLSKEQREVIIPIIAVNCIVFLFWKIPAAGNFMMRNFCSNPAATTGTCIPMLLSAFSHVGIMHLGFNMMALNSFGPKLVEMLGTEHFIATYLTAAVFSSWTSYVYKVATSRTGLSLGASGALFALIGIYGTLFPENELAIIFLPMFSFSADAGIKGLACLDIVGIILRWKVLDHAAHLGGLLFGIMWIRYGIHYVDPLLKWWHEQRRTWIK